MKGIIVVKVDRCMGCRSCEIACAVERSSSKVLAEAIDERPSPAFALWVEKGRDFVTPLQCRQCDDAPCIAVCPTHALHRREPLSPVQVDFELCIGCQMCVLACPFGVIRLDQEARAIVKCNQCLQRVEKGLRPACVSACLTGALEFKDIDEVLREKREAYLVAIERTTHERELA